MAFDFSGKRVWVTGAGRGIGREVAIVRTITGLPDQFKLGIPLRKIATPAEIANTVLFLASDLASNITLQDLVVYGGATLST